MKILSYLQGVLAELKKVSWPNAATVGRHFLNVVAGIAFATLLVGAFDFIFLKGLALIIK